MVEGDTYLSVYGERGKGRLGLGEGSVIYGFITSAESEVKDSRRSGMYQS